MGSVLKGLVYVLVDFDRKKASQLVFVLGP